MITIDGWITIGTKLSTDKFDKQISDLENKIDSEEKKQELLNNKTQEYKVQLQEANKEVAKLGKEYDSAKAKAQELKKSLEIANKNPLINTSLMTRDYDKQVQKVAELEVQLGKAEAKQSKLRDKAAQTKLQYENSGKAVDRLRGKISQINLKRQQNEFKEVEKSTNRIKDGIQNTISKIGKMAMAVLGIRSAFMLLRQASSTWAQYNEQYAKDLEYIRFALASGIAPILEKIVSLAQTLMAYVNYLTNAWFGKTIFASAKDFEKMQKSASGVAKSTKEIKNNLAGFDELNVLSSNQDSGVGGGVTAPSIDIEEVEIPKWLIWIKDNGELIRDILIGVGIAVAGIKLAKLLSSLGLISEKLISIKALGIGAMIYGIVDGIRSLIKYLKDPSYENFGNMIKDIGIAIIGLGALLGSVPIAVAGAGVLILGIVIKYWEQIKEFLQNGIDWLRGLGDKVEKIFGKPIRILYDTVLDILQIILNTFDSTFEAIKGVFDGFIMFIKGVFTGDWQTAWEGIKNIFSSLWDGIVGIVKGSINIIISLINGMLSGLESGLNWVIDKINTLSFEVPDWVPGIGGQVWGFSLPKFNFGRIPLLAKGGIVAKPTQAIIGEAGREAVMPLDNNTEWMDLLADRLSERLGTGAGEQEVTIRFEGTMAQFVRELKPHIEVENKRVGTKIITGGAY